DPVAHGAVAGPLVLAPERLGVLSACHGCMYRTPPAESEGSFGMDSVVPVLLGALGPLAGLGRRTAGAAGGLAHRPLQLLLDDAALVVDQQALLEVLHGGGRLAEHAQRMADVEQRMREDHAALVGSGLLAARDAVALGAEAGEDTAVDREAVRGAPLVDQLVGVD